MQVTINIPTQCIDSMETCITLIYNKTHVGINLNFENIQLTITYMKPPKSQVLIPKKNTHKPNLRLRLIFERERERERLFPLGAVMSDLGGNHVF